MPFSPDYSDYLRMKRIQKTIDVDSRIEARKTRSTYAYGAYNPTYRIGYLPPNLFLPGRLYPSGTEPGPTPPSGKFETLMNITSNGTKFAITFRLADGQTAQVDFGDGTIEDITSDADINHTTYTSGETYTLKVSNPTAITRITCSSVGFDTVILTKFTSLERVLFGNAADLTTLTDIPPGLTHLLIYYTGVSSITIPPGSQLAIIDTTFCSNFSTITGTLPSTIRGLSIQGTAINTCQKLQDLANTLPTVPSGEGTVNYTDPGGCSLTIPSGWTFTIVP